MLDLALWMVGDIAEVSGQSETFIRERSVAGGGSRRVDVDDASSALLRFETGARGVVEMARAAPRRPCDLTVEANGDRGTLVFEYPRLNELRYGDGGDDLEMYGMRTIRAERPTHPYEANAWPMGQGIGYGETFVNQVVDLLSGWPDAAWVPGFADGAAVQAVCDAIERSALEKRWVAPSEITGMELPAT